MNEEVLAENIPTNNGPIEEAYVASWFDPDSSDRLWLRTITPLLKFCSRGSAASPRVQFALDRVAIAAAERAVRILDRDLPVEES